MYNLQERMLKKRRNFNTVECNGRMEKIKSLCRIETALLSWLAIGKYISQNSSLGVKL